MSHDTLLHVQNIMLEHPSSPNGDAFTLHVRELEVIRGKALALCGPSGSGKSTLLSILAGLKQPDSGTVIARLNGAETDLYHTSSSQWRVLRRHFGIVHQDPRRYLNDRRLTVDQVADPLHIHRLPGIEPGPPESLLGGLVQQVGWGRAARERRAKASAILKDVGITSDMAKGTPSTLSGGQRQRVAIARSLVAGPDVLFLDEPTSALDVSVQASIIDLLSRLRKQMKLTLIFVSHELGLVRQFADQVAILDRGRIVEMDETETVFQSPQSELTRRLLAACRNLSPRKGANDLEDNP